MILKITMVGQLYLMDSRIINKLSSKNLMINIILKNQYFHLFPLLDFRDNKSSGRFWSNNDLSNLFFISSLNGKSIFNTSLDKEFNKVVFIEKIFIGQRIRDLIFYKESNSFVLALERPAKILYTLKLKNLK